MRKLSQYKRDILAVIVFLIFISLIFSSFTFLLFLLFIIAYFAIPKERGAAILVSELSSMLNSGYTLLDAIEDISINHPGYKKKLMLISSDVKNGGSFAAAFKKHIKRCPEIIFKIIKEGEQAKSLPQFMKTYQQYQKQEALLGGHMVQTMSYPMVIIAVYAVLIMFLLTFIVPPFAEMFFDMGSAGLPNLTLSVLFVGDLINEYWYFTIIVGVIYLYKRIIMQRGFFNRKRDMLNILLLSLFTHSNLENGTELGQALVSSTRITGIRNYVKEAASVLDRLKNGTPFLKVFEEKTLFPDEFISAIYTGSVTGDINSAFDNLNEMILSQHSFLYQTYIRKIAAVSYVLIGLTAAWILIAMYLPIFMMGTFA